mgnify:CR=1 FL=1
MNMRAVYLLVPLVCAGLLAMGVSAQQATGFEDPDETRRAMARALQDRQAAEARAQRLEAAAARAGEAAEKTARQAAALAARIQESEAGIAAAQGRLALVRRQHQGLMARLAERRQPVVRLTAALQRFSRRPLALSVMRPGSVKEMTYLSAILSSTVPEVRRRTAALRSEIERGRALQAQAEQAVAALQAEEAALESRHAALAAIEARQRLDLRQASGDADREAERALSLAEEARDLDALLARLDEAGELRQQLADLPGPLMRPPRPADSVVLVEVPTATGEGGRPPASYQLPVSGRTLAGFGAQIASGNLSRGVTLAPREGALVVAPAAGRVVFAGPYRGYGRIVIIEHDGGWTSLVTGMVRLDVEVGQQLMGGAPLGIAAPRQPAITLELRRDGQPVNPLEFLG